MTTYQAMMERTLRFASRFHGELLIVRKSSGETYQRSRNKWRPLYHELRFFFLQSHDFIMSGEINNACAAGHKSGGELLAFLGRSKGIWRPLNKANKLRLWLIHVDFLSSLKYTLIHAYLYRFPYIIIEN